MHTTLIAALLTATPGSPATVQDEAATIKSLYPPARAPITIQVGGEDDQTMSLYELVTAYGDVTGQAVSASADVENLLRNQRVPVDRFLEVPRDEVQTVFESLILDCHFIIAPSGTDEIPIVRVESLLGGARADLRSRAIAIPSSELQEVGHLHPATIMMTTIELPNTDVRQVSNSMRTMITDANTQQMLPAGNSSSMVLIGLGAQLASLADSLRAIDDASKLSGKSDEERIEIVALKHGKAVQLDAIVSTLFGLDAPAQSQQGPTRPYIDIAADPRTNSIVLRGIESRVQEVRTLITSLDTPATGSESGGGGSK